MKQRFFIQLAPGDRQGWLRFAFYTLETLVLCMAARDLSIYSQDSHNHFGDSFYVVYAAALVALFFVCRFIRKSNPIHAAIGYFTLIVLVVTGIGKPVY